MTVRSLSYFPCTRILPEGRSNSSIRSVMFSVARMAETYMTDRIASLRKFRAFPRGVCAPFGIGFNICSNAFSGNGLGVEVHVLGMLQNSVGSDVIRVVRISHVYMLLRQDKAFAFDRSVWLPLERYSRTSSHFAVKMVFCRLSRKRLKGRNTSPQVLEVSRLWFWIR